MGEIARRGIGFGTPDPVSWPVVETFARKFALNVGNELGLIAGLDRCGRLGGLQPRCKRYFTLQQRPSGENRRWVRALLQKQGVGNDRKGGKCRHDQSNKFPRVTANRGRNLPRGVERTCLFANRPSRHFFDPTICSNWEADLNDPHAADCRLNRKLGKRDNAAKQPWLSRMREGAKSSAHPFVPRGAPLCRHNSKPA